MERLRKSLEGRPFEVLAVNLAEPRSRIEKFLDQMPLGFPILLDRGVRLWEGLEGLEADYRVEATSSPRGVTHVTFTRTSA